MSFKSPRGYLFLNLSMPKYSAIKMMVLIPSRGYLFLNVNDGCALIAPVSVPLRVIYFSISWKKAHPFPKRDRPLSGLSISQCDYNFYGVRKCQRFPSPLRVIYFSIQTTKAASVEAQCTLVGFVPLSGLSISQSLNGSLATDVTRFPSLSGLSISQFFLQFFRCHFLVSVLSGYLFLQFI